MSLPLQALASSAPPELANRVPKLYDARKVIPPRGNPPADPLRVKALVDSIGVKGQYSAAFICKSEEVADDEWLCLEGNTRAEACRVLNRPLLAIDLERRFSELEQIKFCFDNNYLRRVMSMEEVRERAHRFMVLSKCTSAVAAKTLGISPATLSRAFGDTRIAPPLRERAELLGPSSRYLISTVPPALQEKALEYAETENPTRDELAAFIKQLKKGDGASPKPKVISIPFNGRLVSFSVTDADTVATVTKDVQALLSRLGKHAEVPPDGWGYLFQ